MLNSFPYIIPGNNDLKTLVIVGSWDKLPVM